MPRPVRRPTKPAITKARKKAKGPIFGRLASLSKKDRVVAAIREAIVSGRMQPGDPIVEIQVARQLGVSQPLVREALLALEHQGFVQRRAYRGTSVTKLSEEDIAQIQAMRAELEGLAVLWARERVTQAQAAELRAYVDGMQQAAARGDLTAFNDNDLAFHRGVWQLSANQYLVDCLERAVVPLLTFFYLRSGRIGELHVRSVEEHRAILQALTDRTTDVRSAMRQAFGSLRDQCEVLVSLPAGPTPGPRG
ncbi:MAG: GntR family transcriptional regulator [Vicinamibacteria bacterium]